jgi:hypothetical protein
VGAYVAGPGAHNVTGVSVVTGVRARGATSQFGGVTVRLVIAGTGCGGGMGLPVGEGAGCGLAEGNGGSPDPFGCLSVLDLVGDAGRRASLVLGIMPLAVELADAVAGVCVSTGLVVVARVAGVMWVRSAGPLDGTEVGARCFNAVT